MSAPKAYDQWNKDGKHLSITHEAGCRYERKPYPINECSCACYERFVFTAGYMAAKGIAK